MKEKAKISVAMTSYNGEKYIRQQVQSILNQTQIPDELIICDDCSTDKTAEIIQGIISDNKTDCTICFFQNERNLGYIGNFYKAISLTTGDYIFLSDQDDIWKQNKIEALLGIMKTENCTALCTNCDFIDSGGNKISNRSSYRMHKLLSEADGKIYRLTFWKLAFGNVAQGCTYCFTDAVKNVYLKCQNEGLIHDHQIMLIAANMGKVLLYNEPLIEYRIHTSNAVGFNLKSNVGHITLKQPSKEPFMVTFINDLCRVQHVRNAWIYRMLYYMRIPYIVSVIRKYGLKANEKV